MIETHLANVGDLDANLVIDTPQYVTSRSRNPIETAVDPDQCTLVIDQVEHDRVIAQQTRPHNEIDVLMNQRCVTRTDDVDPLFRERIPAPYAARLQHRDQIAVAEQEAALMRPDFLCVEHWGTSIVPLERRTRCVTPSSRSIAFIERYTTRAMAACCKAMSRAAA